MNTSIPGTDSDLQVREGPNLKNNIFLLPLKAGGQGFSPAIMNMPPQLLAKENRRKIEPKEILSSFIPRLLVVFTRQLEILVTSPL